MHRKTSKIRIVGLNASDIHHATFSKKYQFGSKENKSYFDEIIKQAQKNHTKIHLLELDDQNIGFVSLSIQCSTQKKSKIKYLNIDYVFVDEQYRKNTMELFQQKVSEYLIDIVIRIALEIKNFVPIAYIAAEPAHNDLESLYTSKQFVKLENEKHIFFFKLD